MNMSSAPSFEKEKKSFSKLYEKSSNLETSIENTEKILNTKKIF